MTDTPTSLPPQTKEPWPALWALVLGFFMILVDANIVQVAMPHIMRDLHADINEVIWVTSAYLLAYAVPLLITGRLGDRYGPKNVYCLGLIVFTVASLACGLADSVTTLIVARAVQGLGAALLTPQTMAVITRTFAPERRGAAMGLWGSVAGVAILVGPILGGVLVDSLGWEWIFFINLPVGVLGLVLAIRLVPRLPISQHSFDWLGVLLSAIATFLIVFGIQEGEAHDWGAIWGPVTVVHLIIAGLLVMAVFIWWQGRNPREPLLPLSLFRDRNFALANIAIAAVGFVVTCQGIPLYLYAQSARGLTSTQSALLMIPLAVISGALAPFAGKYIQSRDPRPLAAGSLLLFAVGTLLYAVLMRPSVSILWLLVPSGVLGLANAGIWGPLAITATRNLPPRMAGAGAGVYNTTRQLGAVLGSAAIAAVIDWRLKHELPTAAGGSASTDAMGGGSLPDAVVTPFSSAMAQSMLVPAAVVLVAACAALFFQKPGAAPRGGAATRATTDAVPDQGERARP